MRQEGPQEVVSLRGEENEWEWKNEWVKEGEWANKRMKERGEGKWWGEGQIFYEAWKTGWREERGGVDACGGSEWGDPMSSLMSNEYLLTLHSSLIGMTTSWMECYFGLFVWKWENTHNLTSLFNLKTFENKCWRSFVNHVCKYRAH